MDFGFARFLEMFEERFGRTATTVILAMLGLAATAWAVKTIIEVIIYIYRVVKSANLIAALKRESFASHIIIFGAQIVLTFIVIAIIWRAFYLRQIHVLEHGLDATEAKLNGILERVQNDIQDFEKKVHDLNNKEDKLGERLAELKARQEEIMARHGKSESKPAIK